MATRKFRKQSSKKNKKNRKHATKRHRKSRKQRKMIGGENSKILGEGGYGMVITPNFPCSGVPSSGANVSKLFKRIKDFDEERHIGEVLRGVGINPEFFILPLNSCEYNITNTDKNKFAIEVRERLAGWLKNHIIYPKGDHDLAKESTSLSIGTNVFFKSKNIINAISIFTNKSRNILQGLKQLHDNGYFHNDIKDVNCVVAADGLYKIIDVGGVQPFITAGTPGTPYAEMKMGLPGMFRCENLPTISCFSYFFDINLMDECHSYILQLPLIPIGDSSNRMSLFECFTNCVNKIGNSLEGLKGFWDSCTKYKPETLKSIIGEEKYIILAKSEPTHINVAYVRSNGQTAYFSIQDLVNLYKTSKVEFASTIFGRRFLAINVYNDNKWTNYPITADKLKENREKFLKLQDYGMSRYLLKYLYFTRKSDNDSRINYSRCVINSVFGRLKVFLGSSSATNFKLFGQDVTKERMGQMVEDIYHMLMTNELFAIDNVNGWIDQMFENGIYARYMEMLSIDLAGLAQQNTNLKFQIVDLSRQLEFPPNLPLPTTEEQVKKQYKLMALKYHPDKNRAKNATATFQGIGTAYQQLLKIVGSRVGLNHDKVKEYLFRRVDLYAFGFMLLTALNVFLGRNKIEDKNIEKIIEHLVTITKYLFLSFQKGTAEMITLYDRNIVTTGGGAGDAGAGDAGAGDAGAGDAVIMRAPEVVKGVEPVISQSKGFFENFSSATTSAFAAAKSVVSTKTSINTEDLEQLEFLLSIDEEGNYKLPTEKVGEEQSYQINKDIEIEKATTVSNHEPYYLIKAVAASAKTVANTAFAAKTAADNAALGDVAAVASADPKELNKLLQKEKEAARAIAENLKLSIANSKAEFESLSTIKDDTVWEENYLALVEKMDQLSYLSDSDNVKLDALNADVKKEKLLRRDITRSEFQYLEALNDAYYISLSTVPITDDIAAADDLTIAENKIITILNSDAFDAIFIGSNQKISFEGIDVTVDSIDEFMNSHEYVEWMCNEFIV